MTSMMMIIMAAALCIGFWMKITGAARVAFNDMNPVAEKYKLGDELFMAQVQAGITGDLYYVDPVNGNDAYDGAYDTPYKTLQAAIDVCTDWAGDGIIVKSGTMTVTEAVNFNVKGITVIGSQLLNPYANGERHCIYGSHTDGPAANVLQPCTIVGIGFCGSQTAGASLVIDCDEDGSWPGGFSLIAYCRFSHWGIAKAYALQVKGGGDNMIYRCMFDGLWTGYTTSAIYLEDSGAQGVWNLRIIENEFFNIGSGKYCIQLKAGCHFRQGIVKGNINSHGSAKFFNAAAQAGDAIFIDNYTMCATDGGSYSDTVNNLQTLGYDFANNHYSE